MSPEVALQNIYNATRLAKLTAEEHEFLVKCAKIIEAALSENKSTEL